MLLKIIAGSDIGRISQIHRVKCNLPRVVNDADPGDHARVDNFRQLGLQCLRQRAVGFPIPFENSQQNIRISDRATDAFRQNHCQVAVGDVSADFLIGKFPIGQITRQAKSADHAQHYEPNNQQGSSPITVQAGCYPKTQTNPIPQQNDLSAVFSQF